MVERVFPLEQTSDPAANEIVLAEGVSFDNFLKYFGEQHTEWLMGKVILVVTNNTKHQRILVLLTTLFNFFLTIRSLGQVLLAGVPMKVGDDRPAREPDLLIVLNEHVSRIKPTYLDGPADIAVEIVSSESVERDRGKKLLEYEAAGVREYWLLDPLRRDSAVYALAEDGHYRRVPLDAAGRLASVVLPGFALHPDLLWRDEPPNSGELAALVQQMTGSG